MASSSSSASLFLLTFFFFTIFLQPTALKSPQIRRNPHTHHPNFKLTSASPPISTPPLKSPSKILISPSTPPLESPSKILISPSTPPLKSPSKILISPSTPPLVPALFVLGDSSVDCGTNNFLLTFARANFLPYGRDFDTHQPTGRFCNGRIPVDYLAIQLGLPFIPAYLGHNVNVQDMIHGVNYASAGSGIIFSSGSELGQHISLTQQIQQAADTFQHLRLDLGEETAIDIISKSVFYISIGSNDYIHYYLRNVSRVQSLYRPWSFNQFLTTTIRQELKNLYNANVRRIVVMGLAPMGCAPHYLWQYNSNKGECVKEINDIIMEFNFAMRYMVEELSKVLIDANIIFCDAFEASMDIMENRKSYGFEVIAEACCGLGSYRGWLMCISPEMACRNASTHVWWDQFHPTAAVNKILAENVWSDQHMKMCYPMNLKEMVGSKNS